MEHEVMAKKDKEKPKGEWTYKSWYEKNKEELSERRRKKYHKDKKYREKILAQNKAYRDKKAKERADQPKPKVRIPKHRKPVTMGIQINGSVVESQLVHVGTFARAIGRSVPTIHQWERVGLLPRTPYLLKGESKQERLYTADMIRVVQEVLSTRGTSVSSQDPTFRQEILDGWEELGTVVEEE